MKDIKRNIRSNSADHQPIEKAKIHNKRFELSELSREFSRIDTANIVTGCKYWRKFQLAKGMKDVDIINRPGIECAYKCSAAQQGRQNQINWSDVIFHKDRLGQLYTPENEAMTIYVNYLSDFTCWPIEALEALFEAADACPWNQYLLLTCWPNMLQLKSQIWRDLRSHPNLWMGVSVRSPDQFHRVTDAMGLMKANHWWLNIEPVSAEFKSLDLPKKAIEKIHWICVAPRYSQKAMDKECEWMVDVAKLGRKHGIPVAMKKGVAKDATSKALGVFDVRDRLGDRWIREYPDEFHAYEINGHDDATDN